MTVTADSSVIVPALAPWHEHHAVARAALAKTDLLISHVLAETFAVLTGLPAPHRVPVPAAVTALTALADQREIIEINAPIYRDVIARAEAANIVGGAIYDALIGATTRQRGATLYSLDKRAQPIYDALAVNVSVPS